MLPANGRGASEIYLPHELACNMLASRYPLEGMTLEATIKNKRVLSLVKENILDCVDEFTVGVQYHGSRVNGYCEEDSDVDLMVIEFGGPKINNVFSNVRSRLDTVLIPSENVCSQHAIDGHLDPDEGMSLRLPRDFDSYRAKLLGNEEVFVPLIEEGVFFSPSQRLARASLLACLLEAYDSKGLAQRWKDIVAAYDSKYVTSSRKPDDYRDKIASRYLPMQITDLFWDFIIYNCDDKSRDSLLRPYMLADDEANFGYDSDVFASRVMSAVYTIFSKDFFRKRRELYGLKKSPEELLLADLKFIDNDKSFRSNTMYDCYKDSIKRLRGVH